MTVAIVSLISLTGLAVLFGWLIRDYEIDRVRQDLFEIRDELFDLARTRQHGFSFDAPVYHQLRSTINGHIRFAPTFDFVSALILSYLVKPDSRVSNTLFEDRWSEGLQALTVEGRLAAERLRMRMHAAAAMYSVFSVPHLAVLFGVPLVVVVLGRFALRAAVSRTLAAIPRGIAALRQRVESTVDSAAFEEGCVA